MNTRLIQLFDTYEISPKDRHDFMQIYMLLSHEKKKKALERFELIFNHLEFLRQDLYAEHTVLFGETLEQIEKRIKTIQKNTKTQIYS